MSTLSLSQIFIYPIKSLRGIPVKNTVLTSRGPQWDRRWMLVDAEGRFLSQRELPQMVLLQPHIEGDYLWVNDLRNNRDDLLIPLDSAFYHDRRERVTVWKDECAAMRVSDRADHWFSQALDRACRLVFMPDDSLRPVDPLYAKAGETVSFADGYPYLIIGEASLQDLNERLEVPIEIIRFRPNLVFTGGTPFMEDQWRYCNIGDERFRITKACARCQIPTIDLTTGQPSKEPTRTLARFRRKDQKVLFGVNACWEPKASLGSGKLEVGDPLSPDQG